LLFSKVTSTLQSPESFIRSSLMSSKRLSRDHHDTEGLTTSLAPRENPPRDIAAEVFNSWLASKYALTSSATIADLMKSCTDYVEATDVDKDSLGGLLDFDKTRGFKRRMDAAKAKSGARIIATGKFWTIKISPVCPQSRSVGNRRFTKLRSPSSTTTANC